MSEELRQKIKETWFGSGGLWGAAKFAKKYKFPIRIVKEELKNYEALQLTKEVRGKEYRKHMAKVIGKPRRGLKNKEYSVQMDIYDYAGMSKRKKALQEGYRYALGVISTFSRRVWIYKLRTKAESQLTGIR